MDTKKEQFMQKALNQANVALKKGEVPVGAVIVSPEGTILARAHNAIEQHHCQTAHAEALAIQKATKKMGGWRLNGCWIYVTLEPCLMCLGLIQLSRIKGIVFGAQSNLFGCKLSDSPPPRYTEGLKIEGGVKAEESIALLQAFFKKVRQEKEKGKQ
jgi:tRNA(adenine34) deaminase